MIGPFDGWFRSLLLGRVPSPVVFVDGGSPPISKRMVLYLLSLLLLAAVALGWVFHP
ncbi:MULTISPECIES: hypothetical protein [Halolamina]|uniref:Uncharacterized protein n=1 Tax=Halolamina pelagica TaxID=699431 RepID=A0A1I5Q9Y7_9EURY|nr:MULTISPECIES: hypothetical protein [Halolamina]NHX35168.1 hypothetical protein [Halolamina sp. R1-12]SFP43065.1 hypothetical protein SAMN05216277_103328 [Halolamina pelagica]